MAAYGPALRRLLAAGLLVPVLCTAAAGAETSLEVDGIERRYILDLPAGTAAGPARPLLIGLHGGFGSGASMRRRFGLDRLVAREGLIAVFPDGVERHWNDGRRGTGHRAHADDIDDVRFIRALVAVLSRRHRVDPRRIYVAGVSNGGMMALRLACDAADIVTAVAAVAASMPEDQGSNCRPSQPVAVLLINGTEDPLVPFDGGGVGFRGKLGRVWSTPRTVKFWSRHNGCPADPKRRALPNLGADDGTRVTVMAHAPCRRGGEVVLYRVTGGGHAWPGVPSRLPQRRVGRNSNDIDATAKIRQFFRRQSR